MYAIRSYYGLFPMVFLYVASIIGKDIRKNLWHLVPGVIMGSISALLFYGLLSQDERVFYLSNYRTGMEFSALKLKAISVFRMVDVFFIVTQIVYYSIVLIRIPKKYNSRITSYNVCYTKLLRLYHACATAVFGL